MYDGRFDPLTKVMLFIEAPVEQVADEYIRWLGELEEPYRQVFYPVPVDMPLDAALSSLQPLTSGGARELFTSTDGGRWTSIWTGRIRGNDPSAPLDGLAMRMKVRTLSFTYERNVPASASYPSSGLGSPEQLGGRVFTSGWPTTDGPRGYRSIYLARQSGKRWLFDLSGEPLDFEDVGAYEKRRVLDRFTPEMMIEYAGAMGIRPFDADFYTGPAVMLESDNSRYKAQPELFTLEQARDRLGIGKLYPDEEVQD